MVIYNFIEFCLSSFGQTNNTIYDMWPNFLLPEHMNSHNLLFGCTIVLSTHSNKTIKAIKAFNLYRLYNNYIFFIAVVPTSSFRWSYEHIYLYISFSCSTLFWLQPFFFLTNSYLFFFTRSPIKEFQSYPSLPGK